MRTTINKIRRSLALRGVTGTIAMCATGVMGSLNPASRRVEALREEADAEFDRELGVETGGIFRPDERQVHGTNWRYGIRYQPVNAGELEMTLRQLHVLHRDFTFVDFGSGKGRAVLVAARFPFRQIIGVEYCEALNRIAQQNLSRHPITKRRCDQIELVHADATEFAIPHHPLVLFFFNPFGRPVMQRVVNNVVASFRKHPRRILALYFTPYEAGLWDAAGIFRRLQESPAIFDTRTTA